MDYFSIVSYDVHFWTVLWGGVLPFLLVGDWKWAGMWLVMWFFGYGVEATYPPEVYFVLLLGCYISSKMIGMLSMFDDRESERE